jgi:uncharacterized protein YbgA (DUF1722 family)
MKEQQESRMINSEEKQELILWIKWYKEMTTKVAA